VKDRDNLGKEKKGRRVEKGLTSEITETQNESSANTKKKGRGEKVLIVRKEVCGPGHKRKKTNLAIKKGEVCNIEEAKESSCTKGEEKKEITHGPQIGSGSNQGEGLSQGARKKEKEGGKVPQENRSFLKEEGRCPTSEQRRNPKKRKRRKRLRSPKVVRVADKAALVEKRNRGKKRGNGDPFNRHVDKTLGGGQRGAAQNED